VETFAPVARLEAIRIFLVFSVAKRVQIVPNGCEECLLEWVFGGGSLCEATTRL
jgi:hypothetical protein